MKWSEKSFPTVIRIFDRLKMILSYLLEFPYIKINYCMQIGHTRNPST